MPEDSNTPDAAATPTSLPSAPATPTQGPSKVSPEPARPEGKEPKAPVAKKRRAETPPRRTRHLMAIFGALAITVVLLLVSCLDGQPTATIHLGTGIGFSAPHRWWLNIPALLFLAVFALAVWLPPFQEPTMDWASEKRGRKLRELIEEEQAIEVDPMTGDTVIREKSLAEIALESALRQAEAELTAERARNGNRTPVLVPDTITRSHIQVAIAATLNTSPASDRPVVQAFVTRLNAALNAQQERDLTS